MLYIKGLETKNESNNTNYITLPRKSFIEVNCDRVLSPLNNKTINKNNFIEDCFKDGVFDDNFYYREGNFFSIRKDFDSMSIVDSLETSKPGALMPGHRCRMSKNIAYVF